LRVQEQVFRHRQRRHQRGFLVDAGDAVAPFLPLGDPRRIFSAEAVAAGTRIETSLSAWLTPKRFETPDSSTIAGPGVAASQASPRPFIAAPPEGSRVGSVLRPVRPEGRVVDVGLSDRRRRQVLAIDILDLQAQVGQEGSPLLP
jgi:hypothetical protein